MHAGRDGKFLKQRGLQESRRKGERLQPDTKVPVVHPRLLSMSKA